MSTCGRLVGCHHACDHASQHNMRIFLSVVVVLTVAKHPTQQLLPITTSRGHLFPQCNYRYAFCHLLWGNLWLSHRGATCRLFCLGESLHQTYLCGAKWPNTFTASAPLGGSFSLPPRVGDFWLSPHLTTAMHISR